MCTAWVVSNPFVPWKWNHPRYSCLLGNIMYWCMICWNQLVHMRLHRDHPFINACMGSVTWKCSFKYSVTPWRPYNIATKRVITFHLVNKNETLYYLSKMACSFTNLRWLQKVVSKNRQLNKISNDYVVSHLSHAYIAIHYFLLFTNTATSKMLLVFELIHGLLELGYVQLGVM